MSYSPLYYVAGIGHLKLKEWRENCSQKKVSILLLSS